MTRTKKKIFTAIAKATKTPIAEVDLDHVDHGQGLFSFESLSNLVFGEIDLGTITVQALFDYNKFVKTKLCTDFEYMLGRAMEYTSSEDNFVGIANSKEIYFTITNYAEPDYNSIALTDETTYEVYRISLLDKWVTRNL